jgi:hypothetical protein
MINPIGFFIDQVPQDVLDVIGEEIKNADKSYNKNLVGNIRKEFNLANIIPQIEPYLQHLAEQYNIHFPYFINKKPEQPVSLKNLWVNRQEKYEFNPPHNHDGLFSFVIWYDIPYTMQEELANAPGTKSMVNLAGHFEFLYHDTMGRISTETIPADKTFNGRICFFPAEMMHTVYPFYSEGERITISGNLDY